jgi:hypothetical protein
MKRRALAAQGGHGDASPAQERLLKSMTPDHVATARKLAQSWKPTHAAPSR